MNYERLERQIKQDEGFRATVYQDTLGVWTIGYGSTYINGRVVPAATQQISRRQALQSLRAGIFHALKSSQRIFHGLDLNQSVRWEVLTNMAYNLGFTGLSRFVKLKGAVAVGDFDEAARQIEDSRYFQQVGTRGLRLRDAMRRGAWGTTT